MQLVSVHSDAVVKSFVARQEIEQRAMYRGNWMVDESSTPVRRLLFTRAPPQPQQSPKTPFDKLPERQSKDVNSGEVGTARLTALKDCA